MDNKKYVLTDETKVVDGFTLHRIKYVKSFGNIKEGYLGGWIESERNLSHEGNCWVLNNAMVYDNARVSGNAHVYDNAVISGYVRVSGNAEVFDNARVFGHAWVCENASVYGSAKVHGWAKVYGKAILYGNARVCGDANAYGNAWIFANSKVFGDAMIGGNAMIYGNASVYGSAIVYGHAWVCENAKITNNSDYLSVDIIGSQNGSTTFFKTKNNNIGVKCDLFHGTINEFREKVKEIHGDTKYAKEYLLLSDLAELRLSNNEDKENDLKWG